MDSVSRLDSKSELLNLESKSALDSEFALDSALGLPEILVSCVRFECCARRDEEATLGGSARSRATALIQRLRKRRISKILESKKEHL